MRNFLSYLIYFCGLFISLFILFSVFSENFGAIQMVGWTYVLFSVFIYLALRDAAVIFRGKGFADKQQ